MKTPEKEKFNPQAFLNARIISPLEQEKLVGGNVAEEDEADSEKKKVKEKKKIKGVAPTQPTTGLI